MPVLIEREEISPPMQEALRRHIVRERERRKQEEKEAEKDFERRAKIEEERKRKEQEDSVTLEQIKEQLTSLQNKHENLKEEKHQLFVQLKKVLHEEDKRKQKLKEQSEMQAGHGHFSQQPYRVMLPEGGRYQSPHQLPVPFIPGHSSSLGGQSPHIHPSMQHSLNQQIHQSSPSHHQQAVKRPLSPASSQPGITKIYQRDNTSATGHAHLSTTPQHVKYESSYGSHSATGHFSPLSSLPNASSTQQGLHATPTRHINAMHGGASPSGRPNSQGSPYSMPLGKQLEHASQKSGFGDESVSSLTPTRGRSAIRMMPQGSMLTQQVERASLNQLSQSPRVRSGSPGKYQIHPEKSHSPFHVTTASTGHTFHQSRFYNK